MSSPAKTQADESFPVAWLLPPRARPAVHAYYAFARMADDVADAAEGTASEKLARLDALDAALRGGPGPVEGHRLHAVLTERGLPLDLGSRLLEAFRADVEGRTITTWADLMIYCESSAVPVGRFLLALFEEQAPQARHASDDLCRALQVLNHVQDLGDDMRLRGRCYLPADWMSEEGCPPDTLSAEALTPAGRRVVRRALLETAQLLDAAASLPRRLTHRGLRAQAAATLSIARAHHAALGAGDPLRTPIRPRRRDWMRALLAGVRAGVRP